MKARWVGTCLGLVAALLLFAAGAQAVHEFPTGLQLDGNVAHICPPAPDTGFCTTTQQDWADLFNVTNDTTAGTQTVSPNTSVIGGSDPDFTNASFIRDFESGSGCATNSLSPTFCAADDTTFATGSKDTLNITNGGWQCNHDNNVNSKIDIMNTYAAAYTIPAGQDNFGDKVLYFAMEKNKNNGTNDVGFWFLQRDANCSAPSGHQNWTGSPHTVGDVLVVSEFSSGGGVSSIFAYKWVGGSNPLVQIAAASGGASDCKTALAGDTICATTNSGAKQFSGNITTPWLTSDATLGVGHTVVPPNFFEGGIDLTRAFESSGGSTAPSCFNTFVGDTRSSTSLGSTLFDYARGHLQSCGARITISPPTAVNEVNHTHTLTVNVDTRNGGTFTPAPDGTLVTFSLLNNTAGATFVNGNTCTTTSGTCTVQIISSTAGTVDIHATATVTLPDGTMTTVETDGTDSNSSDAVKHFVDANVSITPNSAVNEVGHAHTFTITTTAIPSGTTATLTSITPSVSPQPGSSSSTCGTPTISGNTATCTLTINSNSAGTFTANAIAVWSFSDGSSTPVSVTRSTSGNSGPGGSGPATKRFVDAKIAVSPLTAVNEVNHAHTITATVQQDDGLPAGSPGDGTTGFGPAPNGTLVTFSLLNNTAGASFVAGNTCTTTGGTCSVQINSTSAGSVDIHATTTFSVGGQSLTRSTGSGGLNSADANKRYVDARISLSPLTAVNEVNHVHTITATVEQDDGLPVGATGGDAVAGFGPAPNGTGVLFSLSSNSAGAVFVGGNSCNTTNGTCTVQINSSSPGTVIIHATATFSVGGISLTRATGTGAPNSADATKRYVDAKIAVSPLTATNPVGTPHTITATVSQDDGLPVGATGGDAVAGFGPAPNGTLLTFSLLNNAANAFFVGGVNSCQTSGGNGQCAVQINSNTAGGVDIHATTTFMVGGVSLTRATGTGGLNSPDAHKDYVSVAINTGQKLVISDFAKPTGFPAGGPLTGTVTFQLFATSGCSGTPLYSSGPVTLVNGLAQTTSSANLTLKTNGTYNWLVSYSGDANNLPSTSPCGTENTTISGNTPGIVP